MMYLIWVFELVALAGILWYKSKQPAMTKSEQFYEQTVVAQRSNSFLMDKIEHPPYNGVKDK